jgi:hypothetical protein
MAAAGGRRGKLTRPRRSRRAGAAPRTQYLHPAWRSPRWSPLIAALLGLILTVVLARAFSWAFSDRPPLNKASLSPRTK